MTTCINLSLVTTYSCKVAISFDGHCQLPGSTRLFVYDVSKLPDELFEDSVVGLMVFRGILYDMYRHLDIENGGEVLYYLDIGPTPSFGLKVLHMSI